MAGSTGQILARLYDADGHDREVPLADGLAADLGERQLLWIDVDDRSAPDLVRVATAVGVEESLASRLAIEPERAAMTQHPDHIHLTLIVMETSSPGRDDIEAGGVPRALDIVAGRGWVVTVHDGPVRALRRIDDAAVGETQRGALDAAGFLAEVADEVLVGYLELVEDFEQEIDRLDELALRRRPHEDLLVAIVRLRRRIGEVRRALAPHRGPFAALARPEMELHESLGKPWPGLTDRLERALDGVEGLRDLLLGTFDIHMGRAAADANDVMKLMTLLSAVLLPAVVLAGVMGMNFQLDFFESADHFWLVVGAMVAFSLAIIGTAKWRRWL